MGANNTAVTQAVNLFSREANELKSLTPSLDTGFMFNCIRHMGFGRLCARPDQFVGCSIQPTLASHYRLRMELDTPMDAILDRLNTPLRIFATDSELIGGINPFTVPLVYPI